MRLLPGPLELERETRELVAQVVETGARGLPLRVSDGTVT